MRSDALLAFVPIGGNQSLIGASDIAIPSQRVIDLLGEGVGVAPSNIIGNRTLFGTDMGIGGFRPEINCVMGDAGVGATSLNVALQGAVDTGAAGGYLPGTYITFAETGAIALASLTAGQIIARFPWLPAFPASTLPRFLRLLFTPVGAFSAGSIASALVTTVRDDQANKFAAKNFTVS